MVTHARTLSAAARGPAPLAPMLWQQTKSEFVRLLRNPAFCGASLVGPLILFAFIGLARVVTEERGAPWEDYALASLGAYAVASVALYSFGVRVAEERGQRMHVLMRATPLPPAVYFLAKTVTAVVFAVVALALLVAFAALTAGTRLDATTYASLFARLLVGLAPFLGLGFAIGYLLSANGAAAITSTVWVVLAFSSGLYIPLSRLPGWVQTVAPYLPTYHYAELAWGAVGVQTGALAACALWLAGYAALFFGLAVWAYGREAA